MTATNHVLTGLLIVSVVPNPIISLPLALLSHFLLDSLPHYGNAIIGKDSLTFKVILGADMYLALVCLGLVFLLAPENGALLIAGGILAASPDLMWLPDFINANRHLPPPIYDPIRRFHARIQWFQRPKGAWVELAWFVVVFVITFGYTISA